MNSSFQEPAPNRGVRLDTTTFPLGPSSGACCARVLDAFGLMPGTVAAPALSLSPSEMVQCLRAHGLEAFTDAAESLEDLAQIVDSHALTITLVDAGSLWNWAAACDPQGPNHAVLVTSIIRSSADSEFTAVTIEDPSYPGQIRTVEAAILLAAWLIPGGRMIYASRSDLTA